MVAAGGAVGGSLRHGLIVAFPTGTTAFPWVILGANVAGAFLLGLLFTVLRVRWPSRTDLRLFLATGVLGAFTTFSNYGLDVVVLAGHGNIGVALAYSFGSIGAGVAACHAGLVLGRTVTGPRQ